MKGANLRSSAHQVGGKEDRTPSGFSDEASLGDTALGDGAPGDSLKEGGPHTEEGTRGTIQEKQEESFSQESVREVILRPSEHRTSWRALASCSTPAARALLSYDLAVKHSALPLALLEEGNVVLCVFSSPINRDAVSAVRFHCGREILVEEGEREVVIAAIFAAYHGGGDVLLRAIEEVRATPPPEKSDESPPTNAPIPKLLEKILSRAITLSASDIHLEPTHRGYQLRNRVDGLLQIDPNFELRSDLALQLVRRIKVLCELDPTQTHTPMDGAFDFKAEGVQYRIRVSSVPQVFGEKVVLRLLDYGDRFWRGSDPFRTLGLSEEHSHSLRVALGLDSGIIVAAGPTGCGKTSLLYAALDHLNTPWRNITTLEEPVERTVPGINQVELRPPKTFADLLPSLLRQDPDVFLIGEMRERTTAQTAFHAATTGHLALTSLHASNCIEAILRLDQLLSDRTLLSSALRMVISSRLLPLNCERCSLSVIPTEELARIFGLSRELSLRVGGGCDACHGFGHRGRVGVFEVLVCGEELRRLLLSRAPLSKDKLTKKALERGYRPLAHEVRCRLLAGEVSPEHALRALGIAPEVAGMS